MRCYRITSLFGSMEAQHCPEEVEAWLERRKRGKFSWLEISILESLNLVGRTGQNWRLMGEAARLKWPTL